MSYRLERERKKRIFEEMPDLPLVSDDARFAIGHYKSHDRTNTLSLTDCDIVDSIHLFRDFCGQDFDDDHPIYDAIAMSEIGNNVFDDMLSGTAKRALKTYYINNKQRSGNYKRGKDVFTLLDDRLRLQEYWQDQVGILYNMSQYKNEAIENSDPQYYEKRDNLFCNIINHLYSKKLEPIADPEVWVCPPEYVKPEALLDSVKRINLETVLIQSTQTLAWIRNRLDLQNNNIEKTNDTPEMLRQITMAQSLLAPICELLGYDGLAMSLESSAWQVRLRNSGNQQYIEKARKILNSLEDVEEIEQLIAKTTDYLVDESNHDKSFHYHKDRHGILFGEGICYPNFLDNREVDIRWRRKSTGSLAKKIFEGGKGRTLSDVIGLTYIMENDEDMLKVFKKIINQSTSSADENQPKLNSGAGKPIKIGSSSESFIEGFWSIISELGAQDISHIQKSDNDFRDVKIRILDSNKVPYEIQLATKESRKENRIGTAAHIFYKQRKDPTVEDLLAVLSIHNRREHIGDHKMNPYSVEDAQLFINAIDNVRLLR